jgi:hypothetical protein
MELRRRVGPGGENMLSPRNAHAIEGGTTGTLEYWLRRADDKNRRACEYYCTYQGCDLVLHPHRAFLVKYEDREILVHDPKRYKGRGWLKKYTEDCQAAVDCILTGGGTVPEKSWGDLMREDLKARMAGNRVAVEDRTEWFQWLEEDELPLLLGTWMFSAGVVSGHREISRNPSLDFAPTHDEWEYASQAFTTRALMTTLTRLAIARGAPQGLHLGELPKKKVA